MQFHPGSRRCPHHTTNDFGNRRGSHVDASHVDTASDEHRSNRDRLRAGNDAAGHLFSGPGRIRQRPRRVEKSGNGKRRHHGHVLPAGG